MARTGVITMSMREIDRLKLIQDLVEGNIKPGLLAKRLGLSTRQVLRIGSAIHNQIDAILHVPYLCRRKIHFRFDTPRVTLGMTLGKRHK